MRARLRTAAVAVGLALTMTAAPALSATTNLPDPDDDAFVITDDGVAVGDFDIDLRNVAIDHGTKSVMITAQFSYTNAESWTQFSVSFDTNRDGLRDHVALWSLADGLAGVLEVGPDGSIGDVTCSSIGTSQRFGVNGTVTLTIPRTCLGSPAAVAVHVDVLWSGTSEAGTDLDFVDSAPGTIIDDPMMFSAPVASSNTGTVTSPALPVVKTSIVASLSKRTQKVGGASAVLRVRVVGAGGASGTVKIRDGRKTLRSVAVRAGRPIKYRFPSRLKAGAHRIVVVFAPTDRKKFSPSTRTLRLVVRR